MRKAKRYVRAIDREGKIYTWSDEFGICPKNILELIKLEGGLKVLEKRGV